MPWKLILFLFCIVLTTFFVGFNLENSCNINLGFKTYENVPIFLTVLVSFVSGALIAFLFAIGMRISSAEKKAKVAKIEKQVKAEIKKETVTQKSTIEKSRKPSLFEKGKDLLAQKKQENNTVPSDDASQIIHLDDNQGIK